MNKDIAIRVENLSKTFRIPHENRDTIRERLFNFRRKMTYETFKALDDISFEIRKGEVFGIIGRNGSGKSTLLKILAGIYTPDTGTVEVNGEISPFLELGVGLNPELSGKDNIYLNGTILGLSKKEIEKRYKSIVEFSELERFINLKLKNYSSGMQVRLAFSVSIHANKEILLMDEVLAVGDANFQAKCLSEFVKFRDSGKTVILVTHDTATVQRYCDRAMLLKNGSITKIGDPSEVASAYIYQNMSDEEKRLMEIKVKEDNKSTKQESYEDLIQNITDEEQRIINEAKTTSSENGLSESTEKKKDVQFQCIQKKAKLDRVEFFNERGETRNVFKTGDDLIIRVYFSKNEKVENLNFGIAIYSQEDYYIFGINTFLDKIDTSKFMQNGYFDVRYYKINLGTNKYYIKSGVWEGTIEKLVDFMDRSTEYFEVQAFSLNEGILHLTYTWLI